MDDDLRNRFRSTRSSRPEPYGYGRPTRPAPRRTPPKAPQQPAPKPVKPVQAPPPKPSPVAPVLAPKPAVSLPSYTPDTSEKFDLKPAPTKKIHQKKKRSKKKILIISLIILLIGLAGAGGYWFYAKSKNKQPVASNQQSTTPTDSSPQRSGTIKMVAVGDSLAFDSLTNAAKKPDGSYDYAPMMSNFTPYFQKADVRVCNESSPGGGEADGLSLSGYPTFNAPLGWNTSFATAGCNVMNLASEHTNDKGQTAINNMLKSWSEQKNILATAGANSSTDEQSKVRYFTVKDVTFAYLAYTTTSANKDGQPYGVNIYSDNLADQQIGEARKKANLVIVSINWGSENGVDISPEQDKIAQHLADQNADVVLGGGPRVLQPVKVLSGKSGHQSLVWFSLGNFLNSMTGANNLVGGMAIMEFDANSLKLNDPKLMPVYMHYEWTAQQKASNNVAARTNFKLYPLDQAEPLLPKSQLNTSVAALTSQASATITKFAPIKIITSSEY